MALSKDERKALRSKQRAGLSGAALLNDFADDVAQVLGGNSAEATFTDKLRLEQKFGGGYKRDGAPLASGGALLALLSSAVRATTRLVIAICQLSALREPCLCPANNRTLRVILFSVDGAPVQGWQLRMRWRQPAES